MVGARLMRHFNPRISQIMRIKLLLLLSAVGITACSSVLDVPPTSSVPSETAIADAVGARAALAGAYAGVQFPRLYRPPVVDRADLLSLNLRFVRTLHHYSDADPHQLRGEY